MKHKLACPPRWNSAGKHATGRCLAESNKRARQGGLQLEREPVVEVGVAIHIDTQLCRSVAILLEVVDKERVVRVDARLLNYGLKDFSIGLGKVHDLRHKGAVEVVGHTVSIVGEEMLDTIAPMDVDGVAQQKSVAASTAQIEQALLLDVGDNSEHRVAGRIDLRIGGSGACEAAHLGIELNVADETEAQLVEEAPHRRVVVDPHKTLAAYGREGTCTGLVVERHKHVAQVENHIAVFHFT